MVSSPASRPTTSMASTPINKGTFEDARQEECTGTVKNTVSSTASRLTTSMDSTPINKGTFEDANAEGIITINGPVSSTPTTHTSSMDTRKRLHFDDLGNTGTNGITLPDGVTLVEDMLDITQSEILSSDDEFSMLCVEETDPTNWPFSPITNAS